MPNTSNNQQTQLNNNCGANHIQQTAFTDGFISTKNLSPLEALSIISHLGKCLKSSRLSFKELKANTAYAIFAFYELAEIHLKKSNVSLRDVMMPYKIFYSLLERIELYKLIPGSKDNLTNTEKAIQAIACDDYSIPYSIAQESITEIKEMAHNAIYTYLKLMEKEALVTEHLEPLNIFISILTKIEEIVHSKNYNSATETINKLQKEKSNFWLHSHVLQTQN